MLRLSRPSTLSCRRIDNFREMWYKIPVRMSAVSKVPAWITTIRLTTFVGLIFVSRLSKIFTTFTTFTTFENYFQNPGALKMLPNEKSSKMN